MRSPERLLLFCERHGSRAPATEEKSAEEGPATEGSTETETEPAAPQPASEASPGREASDPRRDPAADSSRDAPALPRQGARGLPAQQGAPRPRRRLRRGERRIAPGALRGVD